MPIRSAPYYWLECDGCGNLADYDDFSAWKDKESAIDQAEEWTQDGDRFHCPRCPLLPVDEDACKCPAGDSCPCEADGGSDGLCSCCRQDDHNGACAAPGLEAAPTAAGTETTDA